MNWKNKNYIGMKGGMDGTYYEVIEQHKGTHTDFPAMKDGIVINFNDYTSASNARTIKEMDARIKEYFAMKVERKRDAIILTVAGNAVSCESDLHDLGYSAFAGSPNTVDIYGHKATVDLSKIGKKGGSVKSLAKTKAARENIKKRWADKKDKKN